MCHQRLRKPVQSAKPTWQGRGRRQLRLETVLRSAWAAGERRCGVGAGAGANACEPDTRGFEFEGKPGYRTVLKAVMRYFSAAAAAKDRRFWKARPERLPCANVPEPLPAAEIQDKVGASVRCARRLRQRKIPASQDASHASVMQNAS